MSRERAVCRGIFFPAGYIFFMAAIWVLVSMVGVGRAADLVSCRYVKVGGSDVHLKLQIGKPAPAMLILVQNFPPETVIVKAQPAFKKYDKDKGQAKWLITGPRPGPMIFKIKLERPLSADRLSGEIRYKNPVTGKMVEMAISP